MSLPGDLLERIESELGRHPFVRLDPLKLTPASVLICLIQYEDSHRVLFSQRSEDLPVHGGQISFPGGAAEGTENSWETAIRETEEEVGIPRGRIRPLGRLDDIESKSGFLITPWVGTALPEDEYVLQPSEVVEVFEVPLDWLARPDLPALRYVNWKSTPYPVYSWVWESRDIWGLTGYMLKMFIDRIRPALG